MVQLEVSVFAAYHFPAITSQPLSVIILNKHYRSHIVETRRTGDVRKTGSASRVTDTIMLTIYKRGISEM